MKSKNREVIMRLLGNRNISIKVREEIGYETFKLLVEYDSLDEAYLVWEQFGDYFTTRSSELIDLLCQSLVISPSYLEIKLFFLSRTLPNASKD